MRWDFCWGLVLCACGSSLTPPSGSSADLLSFEPNADASAVPSVVRLHLSSATLAAGSVSLFQGELSSYYLGRVKSGELPDTLLARQIPVLSWRAQGELIVAPVRALAPDTYALAASTGLVGEFRVAAALPLLARVWPRTGVPGVLATAIYCGDGSSPLELAPFVLDPGGIEVAPVAGADDAGLFADRCFHFVAPNSLISGQIVVPQPSLGGFALDPAPFAAPDADANISVASSLPCADSDRVMGLGCASIEDDRVIVRTPAAPLLWTISTAGGAWLEVTDGHPFVVRGLTPRSTERISGAVYDASGATTAFELDAAMLAPRERPVLNEEMANPVGPEPQSEWLELANDGEIPLDLAHFTLRDGGGSTALPAEKLAPGELALLVRDDFAPSSTDIAPAAGARLIRVPALGTSGLSNSGEPLALVDESGKVASALPAVATSSGESLRRRHTYSPDEDASAFTTGAPTPGAPND